jgi:hypothetical protein
MPAEINPGVDSSLMLLIPGPRLVLPHHAPDPSPVHSRADTEEDLREIR